MGLPMAKNVVQKCGLPVLGYDVVQQQMDAFREAGGIPVSDPAEIYKACDVILQILPTHPIIRNSVEQAIQYGKPGNVIVDLSSTAPDIILELYQQAKDAGMFLLDSPVSGGNPMAIAGTLAIMTGGDKEAFVKVKPVLACMGSPVYTGGPASGSVTKLVNNMIGGAILVAIAEGYAFAAKAGIDLQTTFEATRGGFAGGPMYDNKVPKIIKRDYTPGARIAVHRKDILNAKHYAHKLDIDTPLTDVVLHVMDWMNDNGHIDEDQAALVKYYEDKMGVKVGVLSGGQRQAMALLMSTMTPIEFLILDEHTAALDPKTADIIMELTGKIVAEKHLTTIMVTHNLRFAVEYGDRLLMMHQGHAVIDKAGAEKDATTIDHILKKFNEISIECGN